MDTSSCGQWMPGIRSPSLPYEWSSSWATTVSQSSAFSLNIGYFLTLGNILLHKPGSQGVSLALFAFSKLVSYQTVPLLITINTHTHTKKSFLFNKSFLFPCHPFYLVSLTSVEFLIYTSNCTLNLNALFQIIPTHLYQQNCTITPQKVSQANTHIWICNSLWINKFNLHIFSSHLQVKFFV